MHKYLKVKKLHKFILKSYLGPFVLTFFLAIFILLMQFLWRYIDELVGKGLGIGVVAELLLYACSSLVPMALPISVLLSSIMTFGNLAEHYELMAIKTAGISLMKIMKPLIVFVLILSGFAFFFSNNIMPYTNVKMATLLWDVKHQKPEVSINEGVFSDALDGYTIKVGRKSRKTPMLYDIMIYNHTDNNGNRDVTLADSGTMIMTPNKRYMVLTLYNGVNYVEEVEKKRRWDQRDYPQRVTRFGQQRYNIDLSGLDFERSDESLFKTGYAMLNLSQLSYTTDSLKQKFTRRSDEHAASLVGTNYFKKLDKKITDSLWYENAVVPVSASINIDSAVNALTNSGKCSMISFALEGARNAKLYISQHIVEYERTTKNIKRYNIEWHRKFTLSVACILLFFVGAPLGAIIRKGGMGISILVSILFFLLYYVINISSEKTAKIGTWPAWFGMWFSSLVFLPMSAFLTYKAINDSTIMELSTYTDFFRKMFEKFTKTKVGAFLVKLFGKKQKS